MWRRLKGFYPTSNPCVVCKRTGENGIEPRFGYVVCAGCSHLSPVAISAHIKLPNTEGDYYFRNIAR